MKTFMAVTASAIMTGDAVIYKIGHHISSGVVLSCKLENSMVILEVNTPDFGDVEWSFNALEIVHIERD